MQPSAITIVPSNNVPRTCVQRVSETFAVKVVQNAIAGMVQRCWLQSLALRWKAVSACNCKHCKKKIARGFVCKFLAINKFWWRWGELNPCVDWVWRWSLHTYSAFIVFRPLLRQRTGRAADYISLKSRISPEIMGNARALTDAAYTLAPGQAQRRGGIKPPMRTLRSQLFV